VFISNGAASERGIRKATTPITPGTPVYEALRKFKVGDTVFVIGQFTAHPSLIGGMGHSFWNQFIFEGIGRTEEESRAVAAAQKVAAPIATDKDKQKKPTRR
jgi:hypothetical protein